MTDDFGVTIDSGPMDWQIFQQDENGEATIRLKGRWRTDLVQKRVVVYALWYQGESDTSPENRALYKERFRRFVDDLRREMKAPALPIITVQLNRYVGPDVAIGRHEHWEAMRELQRQLSHEVDGVTLFSVCDSGLADVIHNDSRSNMLIGERAARTALGAVYGHDIKWRHPECTLAIPCDVPGHRPILGFTMEVK